MGHGWENTTHVTLDHVDLNVTHSVLHQDIVASSAPASVVISNSNVTCYASVGFCDLLNLNIDQVATSLPLTISHSNISCDGTATNGCRGFTAYGNNLIAASMLPTIDDNFWTHKKMPANPVWINGASPNPSLTQVEFRSVINVSSLAVPTLIDSATELIANAGP